MYKEPYALNMPLFTTLIVSLTRYLKKQFQKADKNKNGSLTFDECLGLTEQLNIQMDKKRLIELFQVKYIRFICMLNNYI